MKIKGRILNLLLVICLVVGLMPTAALAAEGDKTIMLGTSGIKDPTAEGSTYYTPSSYIYFGINGETPIKWRVLDADKANDNSTDGMFLLSEYLLASGVQFEAAGNSDDGDGQTDPNEWQHSDAQVWCKTFASNTSNFSAAEQSAMLGITKTDSTENSLYSQRWGESSLTADDKMFFLSVRELADYVGSYNGAPELTATTVDGSAGEWWLRSPFASRRYSAGVVVVAGRVGISRVFIDSAVRPAFNLDLNSVLFTSAAVGGKFSGAVGADALTSVSDYTGNEWKLTLLDSSRSSFTVDASEAETSVEVGYTSWSIPVDYSGAQTGANEYVSALLCDSNGNVLYYGNIAQNSASGTAALNIPAGLAAGSYTLKVFSEQCNGDYKTDYASALQEISLNVLSKETTPQAVFTAAGDSSGTLSNVDASMKYSTDGGASWADITSATAEITGVTADKDIQVVKKGDGTTTVDSDAQIIDVTQAAQPAGIGKTDCTTAAQNDGTITGVDSTMEYRLSEASEWTSISGNTVSGLANGTYEVRVKASGTVLASAAATVTIGAHTCAAQGDWQHDETGHWNTCECGEKLNEAAHTFEWVIDKEATAAEAGSKHEECTVCGYAKAAVEIPATGDTTSPETGDDSNIALWITVMLAAGAALTGTILYSRKRRYSR